MEPTSNVIDFTGVTIPFGVSDLVGSTFSYIALFSSFILLGIAVFFAPNIVSFVKETLKK